MRLNFEVMLGKFNLCQYLEYTKQSRRMNGEMEEIQVDVAVAC